jgi:phage-related protein
VSDADKPLVWLRGQVKTPPFSAEARLEAGLLLRRLQKGELLSLPHARPMPAVGARCYELRMNDKTRSWRIMYRIDADAIVIVDVFEKRTQTTPAQTISQCKKRLSAYDQI